MATPEEEAAAKAAADALQKAIEEQAAADRATVEKAAAEAAAKKKAEDDPANWDAERAKRTIEAQRESENKLKAELADARKAQAELDKIKAEQLSDQERAVKERDEAVAKAAEADRRIRDANLLAELAKPEHGLVNAKAAAKLIDGVEYDDQGEPTNIAERVEGLLKEHTYLKATQTAAAGNINPGGGSTAGKGPTLTVEEARQAQEAGMDPAYYAALKEVGDAPNQLEAFEKLQAARKAAAGKT